MRPSHDEPLMRRVQMYRGDGNVGNSIRLGPTTDDRREWVKLNFQQLTVLLFARRLFADAPSKHLSLRDNFSSTIRRSRCPLFARRRLNFVSNGEARRTDDTPYLFSFDLRRPPDRHLH